MLRNWIDRLLQRTCTCSRQERRSSGRTTRYRPRLEHLENLILPSTITWNGNADHSSWHLAGNWDLNRAPQAGDDVAIPAVAGTAAVNLIPGVSATIDSLTSALPVNLQGGTFTTTGGGAVATGG